MIVFLRYTNDGWDVRNAIDLLAPETPQRLGASAPICVDDRIVALWRDHLIRHHAWIAYGQAHAVYHQQSHAEGDADRAPELGRQSSSPGKGDVGLGRQAAIFPAYIATPWSRHLATHARWDMLWRRLYDGSKEAPLHAR